MPVSVDKTLRRFTVAYTDRETAGFEIRRILTDVVRVGDASNAPWAYLRDSGLDWFAVDAVSVGDALLQGRAELAADIAADWAFQGIEIGDEHTPATYFADCLISVALA
ncbi:hypothetical protein KVH27_34880 [Streptomyces olivaceus]|uniref:hypothetical protein n=1 Tax=Streptomyces olivaceus TaxID=47716 RepID=UPI001CD0284B|nr:hypothetical protein [Streptomyces olivaceus]MBZ6253536.1 hypothetical protein [Streptomyces olivaceus]